MIAFDDLKTTTGVLIQKQIGSMECGSDASSIYTIHDMDFCNYNLEIHDCCYDGYIGDSTPIFDKDFSRGNPLQWDEIKQKCFSEKWHTDLSKHENFIKLLNSMT